MILLTQSHSPCARKVLVAAHETGLIARMEAIHYETSPTRRNEAVHARNPLGKVPVLILDDGFALFDSVAICDHLDALAGRGALIPCEGRARQETLRMQSLAQGICDAGIAVRWDKERRPEAYRWPQLMEAQLGKIAAACDFLEREASLAGEADLGEIALATALDWIMFREILPVFENRPRLATWLKQYRERPAMRATSYHGATVD